MTHTPEQKLLEDYITSTTKLYQTRSPEQTQEWVQRFLPHYQNLLALQDVHCDDHELAPACQEAWANTPVSLNADTGKTSGIAHLADSIRSGDLDPVTHVEACLAAIQKHAHLNAFTYVDQAGALESARTIRQQVKSGQPVGPLAGIVVAVKDCIDVRGMPISCGTQSWPAITPETDAVVVGQLRQAGAIIIGITTMHELAYGATSDNPHQGRVGHPLNPDLVPGGSSGGSTVAVATGMADIALGTDSAGSVRMPASLCGITGYKPSYGLLSCTGMLPLTWSLDHIGLFARTPRDIAFILAHLHEPGLQVDSQSSAARPHKPFTVVVPENYFFDIIDPEVHQIFKAHIDRLKAGGATIKTVTMRLLDLAPILQFLTICAEASQLHMNKALLQPEGLGHEVRARLEMGQFLRAVDYIKVQRLRTVLRREMTRHLDDGPAIIVTPTVILPPCLPGTTVTVDKTVLPIHPALTRATLPFNLTGLPALSVPSGNTATGLPVGLQIAAAMGQDDWLLTAASAIAEC